jgi:hypothetical protein
VPNFAYRLRRECSDALGKFEKFFFRNGAFSLFEFFSSERSESQFPQAVEGLELEFYSI